MKHSIKRQMAGIFIGVMAGAFLLCGLVNALFLGKYYLNNKKEVVISAYEVLNQGFRDGQEDEKDFISDLDLLCSTDNISMFVMDSSGTPRLYTNRDYQILRQKLYNYIFGMESRDITVLNREQNYVLRESRDYLTQADYLEIVGTLDTGEPFIMQTALESIRESAAISNRFFLYIALAAVSVSSVLIWWLSRRISEPILELTDISRRMTELDFNAKFTSDVQNEVGVLGHHINQLSETLEKTVVAQTRNRDGSTLAVSIDRNAGGVIVLTFTNHANLTHLSSSKYTCDMVIDGRKHYNMVLDVYRKGKKGLAIYPGLSDAILGDFVKGRKVAVVSIVKGKPVQTTFSLQGFTKALGYALDLHKKYLQ